MRWGLEITRRENCERRALCAAAALSHVRPLPGGGRWPRRGSCRCMGSLPPPQSIHKPRPRPVSSRPVPSRPLPTQPHAALRPTRSAREQRPGGLTSVAYCSAPRVATRQRARPVSAVEHRLEAPDTPSPSPPPPPPLPSAAAPLALPSLAARWTSSAPQNLMFMFMLMSSPSLPERTRTVYDQWVPVANARAALVALLKAVTSLIAYAGTSNYSQLASLLILL